MKESHLRNEMREELAKKDQQLTQLQTREKELQEALTKVQENENISKHDLAVLSKEKVPPFVIYSGCIDSEANCFPCYRKLWKAN